MFYGILTIETKPKRHHLTSSYYVISKKVLVNSDSEILLGKQSQRKHMFDSQRMLAHMSTEIREITYPRFRFEDRPPSWSSEAKR